MPTVELTDQQVAELVKQLPPERKQAILGAFGELTSAAREQTRRAGDPAVESRFRELAREWKAATAYTSSVTEMVTHPAYQQIIGLGQCAIPFIVAELRSEPDHWFWALKAITGADPVPPSERGKLQGMTQAWLQWARDHGY